MSTTSRGTDFKRLPTSLFCLLIVINFAKATIDYTTFRSDTISQETKRESTRTTRTILEELIQRNITSGDHLQHGTEHLLQYGALLRTQILDTFGKLVYDHYDDFGMSQIEALYRVYRSTLERKYNIFDIVPSVLKELDTRPTKICGYIYNHVKTCLKESSKVCMNITVHDEPHEDTLSKPALNVTRKIYELAEISTYYPRGFSLAAVLEYLRSGRLRFTPALFSGLLHNVQYDSFDDKVRTAERELVLFLTRPSSEFSEETEKVSSSARSLSELLRNYLTSGEKIFTGKALHHASYLAEHVIREVDAISENIEWLGTVYDNSTINLKYLFELILPNDTMDRDIVDARNYLLHQIKDNKIVEKYLTIEKYQQAGPDQLLMEILGQLRDIHFAEDLCTSLYTHARFWHKSHMIENLEQLLELFDAYENLRGVPEYRELLQNADIIKNDLAYAKNVTVELLCSRPRTCLRIGLEMVKNCTAIDEETKIAIDVFTKPSCQCSCLTAGSVIRITNHTELVEETDESTGESSTTVGIEILGDTLQMIDYTTTESPENPVGLMPQGSEKNSSNDDNDKLGTGGNEEEASTSTLSPILDILPESKPDNSTKITSESLTVKPCLDDCSSSECNDPDCQSQQNSTNIQCKGSDCNKTYCEGPECMQTNCKEGNCTTSSHEVDSSETRSCEGDDCEENSRSQSDCKGPNCSIVSCEENNCHDNSVPESGDPPACEGPTCEDSHSKESTCKSPDCEDNNTPPSVCEGLDCEDDLKANWTVSTEKTPCPGPNCPAENCVGNDCKDNTSRCEGSNCSNVSCKEGDCPDDPDNSRGCKGPDCEDNSQLDGTGSTSPCEVPNCFSVESREHCGISDCFTEPEVECEEDDCSTEPNEQECQTPDCKDTGISSKLEKIGCQGTNCTDKDCEGPDCLKSIVDCEGPNCTNTNCTGPNCKGENTIECDGSDCSNNNCAGFNCTGDGKTECEGPGCSNNNCTGPNCPGDGTMTECESSDCLNNATGDCIGSDCPQINCTSPDCPEDVWNTNCTGFDCPAHVPQAVCPGPRCSSVTVNDTCSGPNCQLKPSVQDVCTDSDCSTETSYKNCNGSDCPSVVSEISTEKVPSNHSTEDQNGDKCETENCKIDPEKLCEGLECPEELTPAPEDQITEEPCITDNCTTVSPTMEDNCEGTNCTRNSTQVKSETIENEADCKGGDCRRHSKKPCEGNGCIEELSESENQTITKETCNTENCISSTISPNKEIEQTPVPTEPSVELASIDTPSVKRAKTFCSRRDPHYRRRRNRLRKMRRIDALTSTSKYQDGNNINYSLDLKKISKKVNKFSNNNVNEDFNVDVHKNSNINKNTIKRIERKFDRKDRKKNPLLQVLGNIESTFRYPETKKNNGRKNAQLRQKDDKAMKVSEVKENPKNSLLPNRTEMKITNVKKNNSDHLAMENIDEGTNSREIVRQKKIQLENQQEGLTTFEEADSEASGLDKSRELQLEEYELEEETKKNDQERLNLRSTKKDATKKEKLIDEEEINNEEIEGKQKAKSKEVEMSAVKYDMKNIGNHKLNENRKKDIVETTWHKLGTKVSRNHNKTAAKSTNEEKNNKQTEEARETKLKKFKKSREKTYEKSVGNDKLSEKQKIKKIKTKSHNVRNRVNKNQRRTVMNFIHEQDDNESVSDDEISGEEELEEEAQTNSAGSQKRWKIIQRGSSTESSVKTTNEERAKQKKSKNKKKKIKADKIHIVLNEKHGGQKIREIGSSKYEEKETEEEVQDDSENLHNGWKILKRGNAQKSTMDGKAKGERNTKTKLKSQKSWNEFPRKHSTTMREFRDENGSQSHEHASLEEIVSQREVVKSRSKMTHNSRKRPTQWVEKRWVKTKHKLRGGKTRKEKTSRKKDLRDYRAELTVPKALGKSELWKRVIEVRNGEEKTGASERVPSTYRTDPRNTEASHLKRRIPLKKNENVPTSIMRSHRLREANVESKKSVPITS